MAKYIVQHRRGTPEQWEANSAIKPREGEIVIEIDKVNNLHKLKIGDGETAYADLKYLQAGGDDVTQALAKALPRLIKITLDKDLWESVEYSGNLNIICYKQTIEIDGVTSRTKLNLQPDAGMLAEFQELNLVFVAENELDGTTNENEITIYSIGDKPTKDYTMQATIVEADIQGETDKVVGIPVGTPVPQSIVTYMGEVNELPNTPIENGMYKILTDGVLLNVDLLPINSEIMIYNSTIDFTEENDIVSYFIELLGAYGSGSYNIYPEKYITVVTSTNDILILKAEKFDWGYNAPSDWDGSTDVSSLFSFYGEYVSIPNTFGTTVATQYFISDAPISISLDEYTSNTVVIYKNGKWDIVADTNNIIRNIKDGESEGSIQTSNARALGQNSIALGENAIAGCMAYYIKSIDLTNKKIYLTNTQTIPTISTTDNTDYSFDTPGYTVGNKFSIDSGNYYGYCGTITDISYNVISYSEKSLGFDSIVDVNGDLEIDDYTFRVPMQPEIGVVNIIKNAVVIGIDNKATGKNAFAEGGENIADGGYAHVEGRQNYASYASHAEGRHNVANGVCAHAEGYWNSASGVSAHVEGQENKGIGQAIHVEGMKNEGYGEYSHVEGYLNKLTVEGKWGHVEGYSNEVSAEKAHAEGTNTVASGIASHAEGTATKASATNAHSEGVATQATGEASHAEGNNTVASKAGAHAEGQNSKAQGDQSHAEGFNTEATAQGAHAEGRYSKAKSEGAHAEGHDTQATGQYAHAEGYGSKATTSGTHAEGWASEASGFAAHAEGHGSIASGGRAHAEGYSTTAKGENGSHAEGHGTIAAGTSQHVQGKYNIEDTGNKYAHIQGNGTSAERKNIHTVDWSGNGWFAGTIKAEGNIYAGDKELVKSDMSNVSNEDFRIKANAAGFGARFFTGIGTMRAESNKDFPTYIDIVIDVNIEGYEEYQIGDTFSITMTNNYQSLFPNLEKEVESIYIKINDMDKKQLNESKMNDHRKYFLMSISNLIIMYTYHDRLQPPQLLIMRDTHFGDDEEAELTGDAGLAGDAGYAFKRIGFTDDCNYIATTSDGRTAFVNAVSDANDGDIIFVMPGTYTSSTTFSLTKDITFIGIGQPVIDFPVAISGGGIFSYDNWVWEAIYEPKHGKFYGFTFDKSFIVGGEANPDNESHHGYATLYDCVFNNSTTIYGAVSTRCVFNGSLISSHYFGYGCDYYDCKFTHSFDFSSGDDTLVRCELYPKTDHLGYIAAYDYSSHKTLNGCKIYAPGKELTVSNPKSDYIYFNDTIIFAANVRDENGYGIRGGYLVGGTTFNE